MKKQCVRCWVHLKEDRTLRCPRCREHVDEELRGEVSRPFEYYFRFNLKRIRHDQNKMQKLQQRDWEKMK